MHAPKPTRRSLLAGAATTAFASSIGPARAAPKTIVWWYEGATAAQQAALTKYLTEPFNASQSDYKLVIEWRGNALPDQLLVALAGGQGPDIVLTNGPSWTQRFVAGNKLLDLNQFAQKFGWKEKLAPIVMQLGSYDGKLIALPKTIETQALFFNQTLFKQKSWTPPRNLAETEALADTMLKAGIQPFAAGNAGQRFANRHLLGVCYNNYCSPELVYKALSGEMPWNAPVFVEAVEAMSGIRVEAVAHDALAPVWRWMLRRLAALRDRPRFERWTLSPREHASAERLRLLRHQKAIRRAMSRAEHDAARQQRLQEREARFETYRQERQQARTQAPAERKTAAMQASERLR